MERMIEDVNPDVICFQEMLFPATRYVPDGYKRVSGLNVSHPIFVRKGLKVNAHSLSIYWEACTVEGIRIAGAENVVHVQPPFFRGGADLSHKM